MTGGYLLQLVRYRVRLFTAVVASWILYSCYPLLTGLLTRSIFDSLSGQAQAGGNPWTLLVLLFATEAAAAALGAGWLFLHLTYEITFMVLLRVNLLRWILERARSITIPVSPGEAVSRFRDDIDEAVTPINEWYRLAGEGVFALVALGLMFSISPFVTVAAFLPLAAVIIVVHRASTLLKRYRESARLTSGRAASFIGEMFGSVLAVKLAPAEDHIIGRFERINDARHVAALRDTLLGQLVDSFNWNIVNLGRGLVLLLAAGAMHSGSFTVGDLSLFVIYLDWILQLPRRAGRLLASRKVAEVSLDRLLTLMPGGSVKALVEHSPVYLSGDLPKPTYPYRSDHDRLISLEAFGLTYAHPGGRGIEDVDLRIERGSLVVITGMVGSGKTTLLRALLGLLPKAWGEIRWNGETVDDPAANLQPPRCAYVPQVPCLFSDTLQDNILMGLPDSEAKLSAAIHSAVFERDLAELPEGSNTIVGPRGMKLSGGQVQRVAAARAFLREPELLVLDDLSSALDVETEAELWRRLLDRRDTAVLAVSHRKVALQHATRIVVLKEGRVEAEGVLNELLATSVEMQRIWHGEIGERQV